jgi:hypothetical protein
MLCLQYRRDLDTAALRETMGRESLLNECPERHAGKVQSAYWHMLKTCDRPLGVDRIRKLLGRLNCPKSPDRFES